ncbi:Leucine aminopeptidase A [Folsomia candida]|uniref:Leucine aminopeptidase A n=1 Tax=Folsomia candida TaxID=158441 RepID=A0A226DH75_FOLCA|nr:Leucine aminopeptidase A [Folsomia candida]
MRVLKFKFPSLLIPAIPETLRYHELIADALKNIRTSRIKNFIDRLDDFPNRYCNNSNGVAAQKWLEETVKAAVNETRYRGRVTVRNFVHSWPQNSIIVRIEGSHIVLRHDVVILGAHFDSINIDDPMNGIAPGSDDNGSGSATVLEALRIIIASGIVPRRSIEFQWYAAEEIGRRGSMDIAEDYADRRVKVVAMLNFDVVGFREGPNQIGIVTDYTSPKLSTFVRLVVDRYCAYPWINIQCGYACSDHASFTHHGFHASDGSEYPENPDFHTLKDTLDKVSFDKIAEFVKLAVAAVIEIAEVGKR